MTPTLEEIRRHCLAMKGAITEEFPFGEDVLTFKVYGKIFLLTRIDRYPLSINLKCEPEHAVELRERYAAVEPGFHMHKTHWNTVTIDGSIPSRELYAMITHSYDEVVKGLPVTTRRLLQGA